MTLQQRAQEQAEEHIRSILNGLEQTQGIRVAAIRLMRVEEDRPDKGWIKDVRLITVADPMTGNAPDG